jgi:hypothetical protein
LQGEEVGKGTSERQPLGMRLVPVFMALDIGEKYQSELQLPPEHLELAHSL